MRMDDSGNLLSGVGRERPEFGASFSSLREVQWKLKPVVRRWDAPLTQCREPSDSHSPAFIKRHSTMLTIPYREPVGTSPSKKEGVVFNTVEVIFCD